MVNKRFWLGILVMTLVFGMTVVGCDNGSTDSGTHSSLNGTWVTGSAEDQFEIKLDNGNYEQLVGGTPSLKGTYTTGNGKLTIIITAIHGDQINEENEQRDGGYPELDSRWYSKNDLKAALEISDASFEENVGYRFRESSYTYNVSGNTLILTHASGDAITATRK